MRFSWEDSRESGEGTLTLFRAGVARSSPSSPASTRFRTRTRGSGRAGNLPEGQAIFQAGLGAVVHHHRQAAGAVRAGHDCTMADPVGEADENHIARLPV